MSRIEDLKISSSEHNVSREEKLKILGQMAGDFLPTFDVGERVTLLVLSNLVTSKDGKKFQPLRVRPLIDESNQDRMVNFYQLDPNGQYKCFVPRNGARAIGQYIKDINPDLKNAVIVLEAAEWKNAPTTALRDSKGRAVIMNLVTIYPYEDKNQATMEDVEKMFGEMK
jgi:20S proteasome alpha/beta subunit